MIMNLRIVISNSLFKIFAVCMSFLVRALIPLIVFTKSSIESVSIVAQFPSSLPSGNWQLRNIAIDGSSGAVYVGAINNVYQLDGMNLSLVVQASTGPVWDNPSCFEPTTYGQNGTCNRAYRSGTANAVSTDNYNQVLVMDSARNQLIVCGNVFQGSCQTRSRANVSVITGTYRSDPAQFVAGGNSSVPTVAFLSPGPGGADSLYVGTVDLGLVFGTVDWNSNIYDDFRQYTYGASTRALADDASQFLKPYFNFDSTLKSVSKFTGALPTSQVYPNNNVAYVSGFGLNGFSYFLTTQPDSSGTTFISRIARVCQNDPSYKSFVEMTVSCTSSNRNYNVVRSAIVRQPGTILASALGIAVSDYVMLATFYGLSDSALCVYTMESIQTLFTDNLQLCFNARGTPLGPQYVLSSTLRCQPTIAQYVVPANYCGENTLSQQGSPTGITFNSTLTMTASPVGTFSNTDITIIESSTVDNRTVVFMGTSDGRLIKIRLDSPNITAAVYEVINVSPSGSAFRRSFLLPPPATYLYGHTSEKVYKLSVSDCDQYTTCSQCIDVMDPYCGWCTLSARCTKRLECLNWSSSNYWQSKLTGSSNQCINVTDLQPSYRTSTERITNLTLRIAAFPSLPANQSLVCVFGSETMQSPASLSAGQLQCRTPIQVTGIQPPSDSVNVNLTVRLTPPGVDIVYVPFTFFNCTVHNSCTQCAASSWGCRWCIHDNRCGDSLYACNNASVATPSLCPYLTVTDVKLVPADIPTSINITAVNLPSLLSGEIGFTCLWTSTSAATVQVPATRQSSTLITCNHYAYASTEPVPQLSTLTVGWSNGFMIEGYVNVTVFSCPSMSEQDCSICRSLTINPSTSRYGCVWCNTACQPSISTTLSTCAAGCPAPLITAVSPTSAVIDGGTIVTVVGTNLGYIFSSIQNVTIGGSLCSTLRDRYVVSVMIVCVTQPVAVPRNGTVEVVINNQTVRWSGQFQYRNPQFTDITPSQGPIDGGTLVTLSGQQLATALIKSVMFGLAPCVVTSVLDNQLICKTSSVNMTNSASILITYDNSTTRNVNTSFDYVENPVVVSVYPITSPILRGGGCSLVFGGINLLASLTATLVLEGTDGSTYFVEPVRRVDTVLTYPSPVVDSSPSVTYQISIRMDGVQSTQNLSGSLLVRWTFVDNPYLDPFVNGTKQFFNELLILKGSRLDTWCLSLNKNPEEVVVFVGEELCKITVINPTELQCTPPKIQPLGIGVDGTPSSSVLPLVKVVVGRGNLNFSLGSLVYSSIPPSKPPDEVWIGIPLIVGLVGGVLVIAIILLIVFLARKSTAKEHEYKRLLLQFDQLERSVRDQCRQAFADLQIELSDLTNDLREVGFPFQDYKTYTYRLLFQDQPVLHRDRSLIGDAQINKFHQLLSSKFFLLVFIRTLEAQQKNFTIQDKTKVASLLMIVLLDKMELAIEIIKVLLDDLIVKYINSKSEKVMLRRTESVVEKLLANWLSLCMYDYLQHQAAGRALYTLFQAIKRQTEKGPIDAITGDACYSLSERSLLRETIASKQLTIKLYHVKPNENEDNPDVMECKMLDCDTITQAKEKALDVIYATTPFSKRPSVEDVELQLKAASALTGLPLNDDDSTTTPQDGWTRVNTLGHYSVKDGTVLIVVSGQRSANGHETGDSNEGFDDNSEGIVRRVHGHLELQTGQSPMNKIRLSRALSNERIWHLIRQTTDESQNGIGQKAPRNIPEIFLTKLLQTKMSLQEYINDLFRAILKVNNNTPAAIKYLFDIFDSAAARHEITDPEVTHNWKNNSLLLRFWANVIPNPHFVFDVDTSDVVHTSLTSVLSALMDSCSFSEYRPTKESPASKLLFAKDVPGYRKLVGEFYRGIQEKSPITDDEMEKLMVDMSKRNVADFNLNDAVSQLFRYAHLYNAELIESLDNDPSAKKMFLATKFEEIDKQVVESTMAREK